MTQNKVISQNKDKKSKANMLFFVLSILTKRKRKKWEKMPLLVISTVTQWSPCYTINRKRQCLQWMKESHVQWFRLSLSIKELLLLGKAENGEKLSHCLQTCKVLSGLWIQGQIWKVAEGNYWNAELRDSHIRSGRSVGLRFLWSKKTNHSGHSMVAFTFKQLRIEQAFE